jgi:hypothetical protein
VREAQAVAAMNQRIREEQAERRQRRDAKSDTFVDEWVKT